jgi:ubiquinone/menaquinone biosynthesis C-methylase UbiE
MNNKIMAARTDTVWKSRALVEKYLTGIRGAIPCAAVQLDVMMRMIQAGGRPVRSFLDLGSGDGILAGTILAHYPKARGVLVDFSADMLAAAKARFARRGPKPEYALLDYGAAKWIESIHRFSPFDAIVSGYSIHHQPDRRKHELFAELFDLLWPGGIFVNVEHVSSPTPWLERVQDDLFIDSLHAFGRQNGSRKSRAQIAREYFRRPDKAANILAPVERQCDWLRKIGFQDVACYFKIFELAVFGGRKPE